MKARLRKLARAIDYGFIRLFSLLPIDKSCVVLQSTPDYADSARAFGDYLVETGLNRDHKIVWLVKEPGKYEAPANVRFVASESNGLLLRRDYWLARAKCAVFTHSAPLRRWRKGQVFIHTTHSASQLKAGATAAEKARKNRAVVADYKLRCGRDGLERMMRVDGLPREKYAVIGLPRLDVLFRHRDCVSVLFPGKNPKKTVLCLETFRQSRTWKDSESANAYGLNLLRSREELEALNAFLAARGILLVVKPHPLQDLSFLKQVSLENIAFLTDAQLAGKDVQLYELIENCDAMLTDYSSAYYDFLLLDRPVGFMLGDMAEYKRGFIVKDPLADMPGEKLRTLSELEAFFDGLLAGKDDWKAQRAALAARVFDHPDGQNCARLLAFMREKGFE